MQRHKRTQVAVDGVGVASHPVQQTKALLGSSEADFVQLCNNRDTHELTSIINQNLNAPDVWLLAKLTLQTNNFAAVCHVAQEHHIKLLSAETFFHLHQVDTVDAPRKLLAFRKITKHAKMKIIEEHLRFQISDKNCSEMEMEITCSQVQIISYCEFPHSSAHAGRDTQPPQVLRLFARAPART